jgi:hypothetical protein
MSGSHYYYSDSWSEEIDNDQQGEDYDFSEADSFYFSDEDYRMNSDLDLFDPISYDSEPELEVELQHVQHHHHTHSNNLAEENTQLIDLDNYIPVEIVDLTLEEQEAASDYSRRAEITDISNTENAIEFAILLSSAERSDSDREAYSWNASHGELSQAVSRMRSSNVTVGSGSGSDGESSFDIHQNRPSMIDQRRIQREMPIEQLRNRSSYEQRERERQQPRIHQAQPSSTARRRANNRFLFSPFMALHFPVAFQGRGAQLEENISYERLLLLQEQLGEVKDRGVSSSMIESHMPKFTYSSKYPKSEEENRCAICLDDLKPRNVCRQTQCNHVFHSKCIEKWLKKNAICPVCRGEALNR